MFDFLKKKIGGFIDGLTKKEEKKAGEKIQEPLPEEIPEIEQKPEIIPAPKAQKTEPQIAKPEIAPAKPKPEIAKPAPVEITEIKQKPRKAPAPKTEIASVKQELAQKQKPELAPAQKPESELAEPSRPPKQKPELAPAQKQKQKIAPVEQKQEIAKPTPVEIEEPPLEEIAPAQKQAQKIAQVEHEQEIGMTKAHGTGKSGGVAVSGVDEKPRERIKLGIFGTVKSIITREVEISEGDVKEMIDTLELELLEADVDMGVAGGIAQELREKLIGSRVAKDRLHSFVSGSIRDTLVDVLTNEKSFDMVERVGALEKPAKMMFIGINGAGKTTTIAKVARLLMDGDKKVVFAAADTFRAAAIEQMSVHADRLGVKVIKRDYGSDPTSVAYDAVNYAKAHGMDAVLIDTAGRQDTNISLINEMKKMKRVIAPDITIYIGESIAGNAMIEQISSFNREVGVDAVILTKMDCDPKGGTMLSISKATGIPIIYIGTGQKYEDLERFDPATIASRIVE